MVTLSSPPSSPAPFPISPAPAPEQRVLLPEGAYHPRHLWWICVLPQVVLLWLNAHSFGLVRGEMSPAQKGSASWILAAELALLAGTAWAALRRGPRLTGPVTTGLLSACLGYLVLVGFTAESMIPASVATWILPPEDFLYRQFALVMPAAFFTALLLSCRTTTLRRGEDLGLCLAALVVAPFVSYGLIHLSAPLLALPVFLVAGVAFTGAMLRLVTGLYLWASRRSAWGLALFSALIALGAPLGGLWLNRKIPFPADFQSPEIYALTLVNGLLVCLPAFRQSTLHRLLWLGQCALFPFALYFLFAFLPFLPFGMLATIFWGAGFLVMAPLGLFLLQGGRVVDGYRREVALGHLRRPALWAAAALLLWPAGYTARALVDRHLLQNALSFAYERDLRSEARFSGSLTAVRRSLEALRSRKAGLQLPFLSDYQAWLVFDGLTLPDDKVDHLYRLFVGQEPPSLPRGGMMNFFGSTRRRLGNSVRLTPPTQEVILQQTTLQSTAEADGSERTKMALSFRNTGSQQGEFVLPLTVPEGVLVSGFGLRLGSELVPGRIFEKKAALWVYQKIRDQERRDPGLLLYTAANALELRVFPVAAGETRQVELEFLTPAGLRPRVHVGSTPFALGTAAESRQVVRTPEAVAVSPQAAATLPAFTRRPYLHFIVEHSRAGHFSPEELAPRLQAVARQFPQAAEYMVTWANFESALPEARLQPVADLGSRRLRTTLPAEGGFAPEAALKHAAFWYGSQAGQAATGPDHYPLWVVVRASETTPVREGGLEFISRLVPDGDGYWEAAPGGAWRLHPWARPAEEIAGTPAEAPAHPVWVLAAGGRFGVGRRETAVGALLPLAGLQAEAPLRLLRQLPGEWETVPQVQEYPLESAYGRGIGVLLQGREQESNPGLASAGLKALIARSRRERVLVPASTFIVMENSAQWNALSEAEKKKLSANQGLELSESVPEPGTAALLAVAAAGALSTRWRRRPRAGG